MRPVLAELHALQTAPWFGRLHHFHDDDNVRVARGHTREMTMSMNSENTDTIRYPGSSSGDAPGRAIEPWFIVLLSSLLPLLGGLFLPGAWRTPLHVLGVVLCVSGLVMLVQHEIAVRRQRNVTDS